MFEVQDPSAYVFGTSRMDGLLVVFLLPLKVCTPLPILLHRRVGLVEKSELTIAIWEDCFVEEGSIAAAVSTLRKLWETTETRTRMSKRMPKDVYRSEKGSSAARAPTEFEIEKILSDTTAAGA